MAAGLARSLGATAIRVLERRARSAARSRAEAAARAIGGRGVPLGQAGSPGLGRRPTPCDRRRRVQDFRCDQRQGPGPAQPNGEDEVERPEREDFGFGRWGVREGGERQGGGLAGRRDRIALPCASLQAGREAVRVHGQVEPRGCVGNPAGVEAGRAAGEVAPQPEQLRRRAERVADGEAQVAQRAFVGVEAQDFCASRGALQREAGAQRPGGGRVGAQEGVEQSEPGAGGEQRIALPCPSAGPRPGRDRRRRRKGVRVPGFSRGWSWLGARFAGGAGRRSCEVGEGGRRARVEIGANHLAMMSLARRFVTFVARNPPRLSWGRHVR